MSDADNVFGHTCRGLKNHWAYQTSGCIPAFREDGTISGCDDSNVIAIKFCPYCGKKLNTKKTTKRK